MIVDKLYRIWEYLPVELKPTPPEIIPTIFPLWSGNHETGIIVVTNVKIDIEPELSNP